MADRPGHQSESQVGYVSRMPKTVLTPAGKTAPRRGRPPGSTSDVTRRRILVAACECFGARGYDITTNRDIGDRAGVTAAAIYQYFDSKLVMYLEAVQEAHREMVPHFREAIAGATSARDALHALSHAYVTAYERFPKMTPFLSGIPVEMNRHPEIASVLTSEPNAVLQMVIDIVQRGVESGEIDGKRASSVVSMYLATTMGLSLYAALAGGDGLAEAVDAYGRLLDAQLFEPPRAAKSTSTQRKSRR